MAQVNLSPGYDGHMQTYRNINLGTGSVSVKAGQTQLYGILAFSSGTTPQYVKLLDYSGVPTVWSDGIKLTIPVSVNGSVNLDFTHGFPFLSGLAIAGTIGVSDSASGTPPVNSLIVNLLYI